MKKTKIHLVRHGEVENPKKVFYGRIPGFFLSANGRDEVKKLGQFLEDSQIAAMYSSPLDRTKETAAIIAEFLPNIPVSTDERLIEVGTPLQGRPMSELAEHNWNFFQDEYLAQGGEPMELIRSRMLEFFEEMKTTHEGEEIVVVSHGDPIMITRAHHENEPLRLEYLRGEKFVQTANGLTFTFEEETITVEEINP